MVGKILSFHGKHRWLLAAATTLSVFALLNILLSTDNAGRWAVIFLISCPYPLFVLIAWLLDRLSRKGESI